jgi:hypothetical protein
MMQTVYVNPHQARTRTSTQYEDLLGDSIERAYGSGVEDLAGMVAYLNRSGPNFPGGMSWTEAGYEQEIARLAAEC